MSQKKITQVSPGYMLVQLTCEECAERFYMRSDIYDRIQPQAHICHNCHCDYFCVDPSDIEYRSLQLEQRMIAEQEQGIYN